MIFSQFPSAGRGSLLDRKGYAFLIPVWCLTLLGGSGVELRENRTQSNYLLHSFSLWSRVRDHLAPTVISDGLTVASSDSFGVKDYFLRC
ncbi:hypothetical protein TNCV_334091 [Trichonephila clavipes]|nr:hypothetical protein TNCV_334091 [Trichonephila clavipes]